MDERGSRSRSGEAGDTLMTRAVLPSGKVMTRRSALAGLGVVGATVTATAVAQSAPAAAAEIAASSVLPVTVDDVRALTSVDPSAIYYVIDRGQEGHFYVDPDDSTSEDDTGLVLVSTSGHRFKRIFDGSLRISWFGAKADYDTRAHTGTPCDDAFTAALMALERFASRVPLPAGFMSGLPTIVFEAGNYLLTRKNFSPAWFRAIQGVRLAGQGLYQTNVYFDCPEDANGTDNYLFDNDGTVVDNEGVVHGFFVDGISFRGVSGTERFMYYADTRGGGTAKRMIYTQCSWGGFSVCFDIGGNVNSDHTRFLHCEISAPEGSVFFQVNNPQSQIHEFVSCNYSGSGTIFDFKAGGILHVYGGGITTTGRGRFLSIDDPTGTKVGIGNCRYHLTDINPEVRDESMLLYVNSPEAHVVFVDPRFTTGHGNFNPNWVEGHAYAVGDTARTPVPSASKRRVYRCIAAHTSSESNRPRFGADWTDFWEPLFEMQLDSGSVEIRGGQLCFSTLLTYGNTSFESALMRPDMTVTEGCRLVNPLHDLVEFRATEEITNAASIPRVQATGCLPYTGAATEAYASTPTDPVDVTLNADHGFDGATMTINRFAFRASPTQGEGLPSAADDESTFLLPRGAQVVGVRLVSPDSVGIGDYQVTNHDGSVEFLSARNRVNDVVEKWYPVTTEEERTFIVTSTAADRADGFVLVEYV